MPKEHINRDKIGVNQVSHTLHLTVRIIKKDH